MLRVSDFTFKEKIRWEHLKNSTSDMPCLPKSHWITYTRSFLKTFLILYQSTFHVIKFDLLLYLAFKNVFEKIVGSWPLAHTNFLLDIKQTIKKP